MLKEKRPPSFLSKLFFHWVNKEINAANKDQNLIDAFPALDGKYKHEQYAKKITRINQELLGNTKSISKWFAFTFVIKLLLKTFFFDYFVLFLFMVFMSFLSYSGPFFTYEIL